MVQVNPSKDWTNNRRESLDSRKKNDKFKTQTCVLDISSPDISWHLKKTITEKYKKRKKRNKTRKKREKQNKTSGDVNIPTMRCYLRWWRGHLKSIDSLRVQYVLVHTVPETVDMPTGPASRGWKHTNFWWKDAHCSPWNSRSLELFNGTISIVFQQLAILKGPFVQGASTPWLYTTKTNCSSWNRHSSTVSK